MTIRKIIYFIKTPFCKRDYERFGIRRLKELGFDVQVWDFTPFIRPNLFRNTAPPDPIDFKGYHLFNSIEEAVKSIRNLSSETYVVLMLKFNKTCYPIFYALNINKICYGVIVGKGLPTPDENANLSWLKNILKVVQKKFSSPHKIFRYFCLSPWFPSELIGVRSATHIFKRCGKTDAESYPMSPNTKIVKTHMFDYDLYLKKRERHIAYKKQQKEKLYCVFLDSNVAFNNDILDSSAKNLVTAREYYPSVRLFFEQLKKDSNVQISVAAHPRSHYHAHHEYYGKIKISRGKTIEMVRQSDFVICHASTSSAFAILYNKPLIFITTDQFEQSEDGKYIHRLATLLDKKPINISTQPTINLEEELLVNKQAYQQYINDYIKVEGSPDIPFWEIFANKIKEL